MQKQVSNIKQHVNNNCLSGVETGHESKESMNFHKLLNRGMLCSRTIISYQLPEAVLTILP